MCDDKIETGQSKEIGVVGRMGVAISQEIG